jgi:hypothetical protein
LTRLAAGSLATVAVLGAGTSVAFADEGDGGYGYHHDQNYDNGYPSGFGYHHDDWDRDLHFGPFDLPGSGWIGWQFDHGA